MQLGRSDRVAVGDVVLAIGNPFGQLSQTVPHGIVSAKGRADLGVATYEDFIQTDAAINEGNSGGALVNSRGQLIGINTAVLGKEKGAEGLSIAIPVDLVRGVVREILQHQRVIRGWIGIESEDVSPLTARQYGLPKAGVAVSNVYKESPALEAGVRPGDIIESIDGPAGEELAGRARAHRVAQARDQGCGSAASACRADSHSASTSRWPTPSASRASPYFAAIRLICAPQLVELFLDGFVATIDVVDAIDLGTSLGDQAGDDQARRSAQVGGHHRRRGQLRHALDDGGVAFQADLGPEPPHLQQVHEAGSRRWFR